MQMCYRFLFHSTGMRSAWRQQWNNIYAKICSFLFPFFFPLSISIVGRDASIQIDEIRVHKLQLFYQTAGWLFGLKWLVGCLVENFWMFLCKRLVGCVSAVVVGVSSVVVGVAGAAVLRSCFVQFICADMRAIRQLSAIISLWLMAMLWLFIVRPLFAVH